MIASVQKAMRILSVLSDSRHKPVPLMEISRLTGYPKPTCSHILETLCNDGYAWRVSQTEGYSLGPSIYHLTRYGHYEEEVVMLCRPVLRWLERKSHATAVLAVMRGGKKFILDYSDTEQGLFSERTSIKVGEIYRTATGRAILAHMDEDGVRKIYEKNGAPLPGHWDEVGSYHELLKELEKIRRESVVIADTPNSQNQPPSVAYAVPFFKDGRCYGAIGIARIHNDENDKNRDEAEKLLKGLLMKGAKEIERRLRYEE